MTYLMGYQVKIKFDDGEPQTGSFSSGFALNFLLPCGAHKMAINLILSAVAKVAKVEKVDKLLDKVAQDFPIYLGKAGQYRVVLGYKMFKGLVVSQIVGPDS